MTQPLPDYLTTQMDPYSYISISNSPETGPLDLFMAGTDEVYVITPSRRGWRFSRVTRRGTVSVTIADGRILPGARILDVLRIAAVCPGGGAELYQALAAAEISPTPLRALDWMLPDGNVDPGATGTAVRTFLSGRDIERMLSFPFQKTSAHFARTVLAPATATLRNAVEDDPSVVRLTVPIEQRYAVIYPDGVKPSARSVVRGDLLSLTYYADGMREATHTLTAGSPSPFVEYDGAAINVRPLKSLGIELEPLSSPAKETAKPTEEPKRPASPVLAPGERLVGLRLRFSDDRLVKTTMTVTDDSPEYRLLRAGMFHGYRARRLAVKNHHEENYLIDLRGEGAGVPAETPAPATPLADTAPAGGDPEGDDKPRRRRRRRRGPGPWVTLILIILAIALGIVAVSYLPGLFSHVDNYRDELETADTNRDTTLTAPAGTLPDSLREDGEEPLVSLADTALAANSAAEPPQPTTPTAERVAPAASPADDYAYLNRATVWHRDSLSTPAGLAVFDSFATGRLGEIPAQDFFASGKCTNPRVNQVIKMIWAAHRSSTQTSNERILKRLEGSASIDFNELFKALAGVQSANPNKRPLPSASH